MFMVLRRAVALALAGSAILPLAAVQASGPATRDAVVLRYHFVAGEQYGYRVTATTQVAISGGGLAAPMTTTSTSGGTVRYHVLQVTPSGQARITVQVGALSVHVTVAGRTQRLSVPARSQTVTLNPDGSEQGSTDTGFGSFGVQMVGTLPSSAVSPGAHWTSHETATVPAMGTTGLPPIQVTAQNTLVGFQQSYNQQVGVIGSVIPLHYTAKIAVRGTPLQVRLSGSATGQSLFGLSAGRLLAAHVRETATATISGRLSAGGQATLHEHIVTTTSIAPMP